MRTFAKIVAFLFATLEGQAASSTTLPNYDGKAKLVELTPAFESDNLGNKPIESKGDWAYVVSPASGDENSNLCRHNPIVLPFHLNKSFARGVVLSAVGIKSGRERAVTLFIQVPTKSVDLLCAPKYITDKEGGRIYIDRIAPPEKLNADTDRSVNLFLPDTSGYVEYSISSDPDHARIISREGELGQAVYNFSCPPSYLKNISVLFDKGSMSAERCRQVSGRYADTVYLRCIAQSPQPNR